MNSDDSDEYILRFLKAVLEYFPFIWCSAHISQYSAPFQCNTKIVGAAILSFGT